MASVDEILQMAGDICDLNPRQSPDARARQLRFLNLAMQDIKAKAPYLLRSDERRFTVPKGLKPVTGEGFDVQGDAWLLKLNTTAAAAVGQWRLDGTHATQSLYLFDSNGQQHRRKIQGVLLSGGEVFVSITAPWGNTTDTDLRWEVKTDDFYLPRALESITGLRLADEVNSWSQNVFLIGEHQGRALNNSLVGGEPCTAYPGGDLDLPQMGDAALELVPSAGAWATFALAVGKKLSYVFTMSWGSRPEFLPRPAGVAASSGRLAPLVESPPCAVVTTASATSLGTLHRVALPDIRLLLAQSTGVRSAPALVGYKLNIYRAEEGQPFHYLASVDAGTTTFDDDGTSVPDVFRPLPKTFGCKSLTFDAIPADQLLVNGVWSPTKLYRDEDTPPLDDTGVSAVVELLVERIHRKLGNQQAANGAAARFEDMRRGLASSYGSGRDAAHPSTRVTRRISATHDFDPHHKVNFDYGK